MPYSVTRKFEKTIAEYCGAKYGVAVSSCTNAIFLCLKYLQHINACADYIDLPKRTYPGVAMSVLHAGMDINFQDKEWKGIYRLYPSAIVDSALRFKKNMYDIEQGNFWCLSFHNRKHIPIGRGGMILTYHKGAADWLRKARFDGRQECSLYKDNLKQQGWNMYLTPDQAAKGLMLFDRIKDEDLPDIDDYETYPDLSTMPTFKERNK